MSKLNYWIIAVLLLHSCKPKNSSIARIDFKAEACFGECPIFSMSIRDDRTATYHAEMFNDLDGDFRTVIRRPQFDSLLSLIDGVDFFDRKDKYSTDETDHPTYKLTISTKDGRVKTIEDYGPSGPKQMRKVYDYIFSLRNSQNWK